MLGVQCLFFCITCTVVYARTDALVIIFQLSHYICSGCKVIYLVKTHCQQVKREEGRWIELENQCDTRDLSSTDHTAHVLRNLIADKHYKIELRAHNRIGFSTPGEVVIKTARGEYTLKRYIEWLWCVIAELNTGIWDSDSSHTFTWSAKGKTVCGSRFEHGTTQIQIRSATLSTAIFDKLMN